MIDFRYPYPALNFALGWPGRLGAQKRYLFWICAFGVLMAFLEFGQDYIGSFLNTGHFYLVESLAYKLFWFIFIPLVVVLDFSLEAIRPRFQKATYFIFNSLLVIAFTLAHLFLFSVFLFGISGLIHQNPWELSFILIEKLSTRFYIGLSIYIIFSAYIMFRHNVWAKKESKKKYAKSIAVKNGQTTIYVDVTTINWISSDGPYLYIHTEDKKHVILDSLKHIITTLPVNFKRIHRSTIINTAKVQRLKSRGNGDYDVMLNGMELRLSRNYAKSVKGILL